jgi:hypothetical protein
MSYDLALTKNNGIIKLKRPHYLKGGTFRLGGENEARINITYNYAKFFSEFLHHDLGIRFLYGKKGRQTILPLAKTIARMEGATRTEHYWDATEGNAREALRDCLVLACLCPDGVWEGD